MKILNIDAFVQPKRALEFRGQRYPIRELDVQEFIDSLKLAEDLEKEAAASGGEIAMSRQFDLSVGSVMRAIPDFPEAELRKLPLEALQAIMKFIRGDVELAQSGGEAAPAAEGEGADAKKPD